ncbi:MAG: hypothetical protein Q9157_002823 [Trypethelium eluteriae]
MTAKRIDTSGSEFSREVPRSSTSNTEFLRRRTIDESIPDDQEKEVTEAWKKRNLLSLGNPEKITGRGKQVAGIFHAIISTTYVVQALERKLRHQTD